MPTTPTTPSANDMLRRWFDDSMTMLDPWMSAWTAATSAATAPATSTGGRTKHEHHAHHECDCSSHDHEHSCHDHGCRCSGHDADLVIVARVGERRIVPLRLHNEWRRERPVTITVSAFKPCDPCAEDVAIAVTTDPKGEIVLAPCSHTLVDIVIALPDKNREKPDTLTRCTTLYGDISTDGCGRPIRLAVVVLPDDCDAHEVDCCGCGC